MGWAASAIPAYASAPAPSQGPRPLIGDVVVFNDEIVEPVSLPVSTCGGLLPVLSGAPTGCEGTSRVSDDDA
ncbi:hypothetical protein [Nonomuraea sp. NPDC049684]|uniref:hypothetical protein n=1 Tax=unclassified Nonomuraea TaxID=2593643 RepID=UPI0037A833C9